MDQITKYIEELLAYTTLSGGWLSFVTMFALCAVTALVAWLVYMLCIKVVTPLLVRITKHTDMIWDDYLLNPQVLHSACHVVPAIVVWQMLPPLFIANHVIQTLASKATAIYITITVMRLAITFIGSFKLFDSEKDHRTAAQQYFHAFCGVLKIVVLFLGVIVIVAIVINRSPLTLLAGLGATSAVLMLVFKDSITGLVAGIRLTSNNMVSKGDWITVDKLGANGVVEDITLSTVKVRNFDNTIVTLPPQKLIEDSFQNWQGMQQSGGRRVTRMIYIDFHSIGIADDNLKQRLVERKLINKADMHSNVVNLTLFRNYIEWWIYNNKEVNTDLTFMVRQLQPTNTGLPIEVYFFLKNKEWKTYEHNLAEIMERIYAFTPEFGLKIYQRE
ncbi:mechanosensitive ion channel domain-containing protein [uncultured Prevotella sp.]|uniref:mechanosensitive ion channel family protein n=1 Tax=uncultured Prevotella sp. TaxID=159272 RepID=UPI0027E26EF4|nr:mechanosensitive ion channel domain-containing protein [uncultured Prevotella sp.]